MYEREAEPTTDDKNMGMICHFLSFCGCVFPFGNVVGPLILWIMKKDESAYVDYHGKECMNFQISLSIWMICCIPLVFVFIGIPILIGLGIADIVLTIIAALKAGEGEYYRYPMTIRFLK